MEHIIFAEIGSKRNTLLVQFPADSDTLTAQLGSIGIQMPADEIPLAGIGDITIHLTGQDELEKQILSHVSESDSFGALNQVFRVLSYACPYDYDELPQQLKASPVTSAHALLKEVLQLNNRAWIFRLKLRSLEGDRPTALLHLPAPPELLAAISREVLGGTPLEHCEVIGHACQWADEFPNWSLEQPEIDSLNTLAGEILRRYQIERQANKFLAAIEAEKPASVQELLEIAQHPERYYLLPQNTDTAENYYDYARNVGRVSKVLLEGGRQCALDELRLPAY